MKKNLLLIISFIICLLALAGCSDKPFEYQIEFKVIESQAFQTFSVEKITVLAKSKYYIYFPVLTNSEIDEYEIISITSVTFDKMEDDSSDMRLEQFTIDKINSSINKKYKNLFYSLIKINFEINDINAINKTKGIEIHNISISLNSSINLHYSLPLKILFIENQADEEFINMEATKLNMLARIKSFIELI